MFKKILLPLDLTNKHKQAIKIAGELAEKSKGEVVLLHVIEAIAGWPDEEVEDFYRRIETKAEQHLQKFAANLLEKKIPCHSKILTGSRATSVVEFAKEIKADLILVSHPGFDPQAPSEGWASLSWKISILSPCPVLLVK